jgi:hypothetical protein
VSQTDERRPVTSGAAPRNFVAGEPRTTVPLTADDQRSDTYRRGRIRRWARRELDGLLSPGCSGRCCTCTSQGPTLVSGDPYRDGHMDRGWAERDALGRELLATGRCP